MKDEEFKKLEKAYFEESSRRHKIEEYKDCIAEMEKHIEHFKNDTVGKCTLSYVTFAPNSINAIEEKALVVWYNHFPATIKLLEEMKQEYLDMIKELEEQE